MINYLGWREHLIDAVSVCYKTEHVASYQTSLIQGAAQRLCYVPNYFEAIAALVQHRNEAISQLNICAWGVIYSLCFFTFHLIAISKKKKKDAYEDMRWDGLNCDLARCWNVCNDERVTWALLASEFNSCMDMDKAFLKEELWRSASSAPVPKPCDAMSRLAPTMCCHCLTLRKPCEVLEWKVVKIAVP